MSFLLFLLLSVALKGAKKYHISYSYHFGDDVWLSTLRCMMTILGKTTAWVYKESVNTYDQLPEVVALYTT